MKLVIDISEEDYEYIKTNYEFKDVQDKSFVIGAIANGIPLNELTEQCIACKYDEVEGMDGEHCSKCLSGDVQFIQDTKFVQAEDCISRADVNRIICEYRDDAVMGDLKDVERAYGANAVGELIADLPSVYPKSEEFEWCTGCKEYDQERHCCHRWTKVIRNTLTDNINAVLEDIKAETVELYDLAKRIYRNGYDAYCEGVEDVVQIINKHMVEEQTGENTDVT